ncbi:NAD(P)H-dependent oxidoreductase [Shewanella youngdeokensis]|uniref:NAD(P)H-dependent oxidoreductase n=1 Tax=Shewanella youngdeokensis TaxID=2999068 RepID=A0ABZ0JV41_9GAMM|nr:NAD(P)H-dependent oxidoreductase [Shewanella sp. DAU334]
MLKEKKKVLVLYAHPSQERSEVNKPLFEATLHHNHVTAVDLYAEYPTFRINIDKEQQRLREHDVIIFMFPLYWYSTPSILKEWLDLVLEYNFAYGAKGNALKGKTFFCAISAGGSEAAFHTDGYNHFTLRELLHPLEQTANLTGMTYLAPFALFGARRAIEENRLQGHINDWLTLLSALANNSLDIPAATKPLTLNHCLNNLIKG